MVGRGQSSRTDASRKVGLEKGGREGGDKLKLKAGKNEIETKLTKR